MPSAWHLKGLGRVPVLRPGRWAGAGGGALGCGSEEEGSPQSRVKTITVTFCPFFLSGRQDIPDGYGHLTIGGSIRPGVLVTSLLHKLTR